MLENFLFKSWNFDKKFIYVVDKLHFVLRDILFWATL